MKWLILLAVLSLSLWNCTSEDPVDPCTAYTNVTSEDITNKTLCNSRLAWGWYRYTGTPQGALLTRCHSGTQGTSMSLLWVKGSLPSVPGNITDVPICLQKDNDCCSIGNGLKLKKCSDFFVFEHHFPPAKCEFQYAFECDVPPSIENGTSTITTDSDNNSLATYVCDAGFSISNGTDMLCQSNGIWGPILPTCTIKDCGPVTVPHGSVSSKHRNSTVYGSNIKFVCNTGYEPVNSHDTVTCDENGNWTLAPVCSIKDCGNVSVPHGSIASQKPIQTVYGSNIVFVCNTGYKLVTSHDTVSCDENGNWTVAPDCLIKDCGNVSVPHGSISSPEPRKTVYRSEITFVCNTGYELSNSHDTVTCDEKGNWMATPVCVIKDCGNVSIPHGSILSPETRQSVYGSNITFVCNTGYKLVNSLDTVTCDENGNWTEAPVCVIKDCGNVSVAHGSISNPKPHQTVYGSDISFVCNTGYELVNSHDTVTCDENAFWTVAPVCVIKEFPEKQTGLVLIIAVSGGGSVALIIIVAAFVCLCRARRNREKVARRSELSFEREIPGVAQFPLTERTHNHYIEDNAFGARPTFERQMSWRSQAIGSNVRIARPRWN